MVTDEEDGSPLDIQQYLDFFRGLKAGSNSPVVISGITGGPTGCENAQTGDSAFPAQRYDAVVRATGGISASLCDDWGTSLQNVGEAVFLARARYQLTRLPVPGSVVVRINGIIQTSGWSMDPTGSAVLFDQTRLPAANSTVSITYVPEC